MVVVGPLENGVEALNDIGTHRAQTDPKPRRISHRQCHILLQVEEVVRLAGGLATMQVVRTPARPPLPLGRRAVGYPSTSPGGGPAWQPPLATHGPLRHRPIVARVPPMRGTTPVPPLR